MKKPLILWVCKLYRLRDRLLGCFVCLIWINIKLLLASKALINPLVWINPRLLLVGLECGIGIALVDVSGRYTCLRDLRNLVELTLAEGYYYWHDTGCEFF